MRVKITYGLDIENVPRHLGLLLRNLGIRLNGDATSLVALADSLGEGLSNPDDIIEKINKVRVGLADVDAMLEDYSSIVGGYLATLDQAAAPENLDEQPDLEHILQDMPLPSSPEGIPEEDEGEK